MGSMQCNVEYGHQLSIRSGTKENHGKPCSSWSVAGPSECNRPPASSPALNPRTLTPVPTLRYCIFLFCFFFLFFFYLFHKLFCFYSYLYVHMIWISNKPYKTLKEGIKAHLGVYCSLEIGCFTRFISYPIIQLIHFTGLHFSFVSLVLSSFHCKKENTSLHSTSLLICQLLA
jgi:hypothetical protein